VFTILNSTGAYQLGVNLQVILGHSFGGKALLDGIYQGCNLSDLHCWYQIAFSCLATSRLHVGGATLQRRRPD